jgi:eukaryotic-like serine/threonine-protein kinase
MTDPHLIGPVARATPSKAASLRGRPRALPVDVLRDASRRLGIMALVAGGLWTVGSILGHVAERSLVHGSSERFRLGVGDAIAAVSVVVSVLLFFYARRRDRDPKKILDLGLTYMVFTAFALALTFHWEPMPARFLIYPQISWIGAVVLMFAGIVPSRPIKTLAVGLVSVSMSPLAMLLARARGTWPFTHATDALLMHYPDYLLVGVAVVISHIVTSLGRQVAKAREMGSYQLGELLGRGGMGEVYKAAHRMLARPAAIKLIRPETIAAGDPEGAQLALARFRREAEAAATLQSPHTVELYDFGVTDDGTLYFVMELLDGMDLESFVKRHGPAPAARVAHILRQTCESLAEAHARGMVHRDVKPANIHLGRLGLVYDFVKVLDFGLVKPIADLSAEQALTTQIGLIIGTPGYMAPEMVRGGRVDGRADLYALGCVAYYLLTGRQVFDGATVMEIMSKHLQTAPIPPSERVAIPIPPGLEQVVLACLAKKPEERPQSAAALVERLDAIDVESWTQRQAEEWWAAAVPSGKDDTEGERPRSPAGESVTRAAAISETGR